MISESQITLLSGDSGFSSSTNNSKSAESNSLFGDGSCGEPLSAQHIVIDFTPLDDEDEFVQKKCCAFWEFISSQPELQNLMMIPESNARRLNVEKVSDLPEVDPLEVESVIHERTAVSMLEIVERKGLIDRTFEAKLPQSQCSLGSRDYFQNEITLIPADASSQKDSVCICSEICKPCSHWHVSEAASPLAVDICRKMENWDIDHPKCMDPPGHPPALSKCVMMRKIMS